MLDLQNLVRGNIQRLKPYSSARSEFVGDAEIFLDANENAFGSPAGRGYNRYPDPGQMELKGRLSEMNSVSPSEIFVGNGSDEAIDLVYRIFCEPGRDEIIICPPTYGMYRVSAEINDVRVKEVRLTDDFHLDVPAIFGAVSNLTKLIFVCSPNNPTGNHMRRESIMELADNFNGLVVVDEAYIHFADTTSMILELQERQNLVVLQTFSKAWGMAGLRVGLAFADESIIELMNWVKPPYNVSGIAQNALVRALDEKAKIDGWIEAALQQRARLMNAFVGFKFVDRVYPSDANFILVKTIGTDAIYRFLIKEKIIVRDRSNVEFCAGCLRITVGTANENDRLIASLVKFEQSI